MTSDELRRREALELAIKFVEVQGPADVLDYAREFDRFLLTGEVAFDARNG